MINNVRHAFSQTLPSRSCLVQEEMVKKDFCHESVRKQQVWYRQQQR